MYNEVDIIKTALENAIKTRDRQKYGTSQWHIWNDVVQDYQEKLTRAEQKVTSNESFIITNIRNDFHTRGS